MESALSPREIQTRIRSGESVDDVARVAGIERERVERFAAPVIAEREHIAGLAMSSTARRRGETSSHRTLRGALNDRLLSRGVDIDTVRWDSYRLDDGRWAVTAGYVSETSRQALFYFDLPGRYSVAGNDEGRWVLGESDDGTEPTLDLSDELALVRAIQDIPEPSPAGPEPAYGVEVGGVEVGGVEQGVAEVYRLNQVEPEPLEPADSAESGGDGEVDENLAAENQGGLDALYEIFDDQDQLDRTVEEAAVEEAALGVAAVEAAVDEAAEPTVALPRNRSAVEGSAPSDASAVPELSAPLRSEAWEPAIVVDYPIEPSAEEVDDVDGVEVPEGSDSPGRPEAPVGRDDRRDEATSLEHDVEPVEEGAGDDVVSDEGITDEGDQPLPLDLPEQPEQPAPKPARRKRASVPSWDEIVFGGPKEK